MRNQRRLTYALVLGVCLGIVLALSVFFLFNDSAFNPSLANVHFLSDGITQTQSEQTRDFSITLPQAFDSQKSLLFKTTHTAVQVHVGDQAVYAHTASGNPPFLKSPGALWHVVDLPEGSAGKPLTISLTAVYPDFYGNDLDIHYGSHDSCALHLLGSILLTMIMGSVLLFLGLFCLLLHALGWLRSNQQAKNGFLFLGLLSLSIATWSLCQSGFLQFILPSGPALYLIDFLSFYLFPVCFNMFVASMCKGGSASGFCAFAAAYLIEVSLSVALQLLGLVDMFRLLTVGHITMAVNIVFVFIYLRREIKEESNKMARELRLPIYVMLSFSFAELVAYYLRAFRETSIFLPLGTIVFIILLAGQLITLYYQNIFEEEKTAYFKKLANTDMLTEVFNRNAYEERVRQINERPLELQQIGVVVFDVNGLKPINDRYGYESGDLALKTCSRCILDAFDGDGYCYRIGGDEFVYLTGKPDMITRRIARFEELTREAGKTLRFPFSVAIGYAAYNAEQDETLSDVLRRGDEILYYNKNFRNS